VTEVLLNHCYVTVDQATFDAAERFLAGFGAVEKRTTVRKDMTYTGLYLYGEQTYLELLSPGSANFGAPSGIAYGVEVPGALDRVCRALRAPALEEITRGEVPWFKSCRPEQLPGLAEWVMEYMPAFFRGFQPELPPARPTIARSDALIRYAASCGKLRERAEGLFEDVVGLEVVLDKPAASSWNLRPIRVAGVEMRVRTAAPGEREGIREARLRLRRDAGRADRQIGTTTLALDGRTAVWRFH
jgi:Family of unknown function (DUF5829)